MRVTRQHDSACDHHWNNHGCTDDCSAYDHETRR
jgi:hypothetical protein